MLPVVDPCPPTPLARSVKTKLKLASTYVPLKSVKFEDVIAGDFVSELIAPTWAQVVEATSSKKKGRKFFQDLIGTALKQYTVLMQGLREHRSACTIGFDMTLSMQNQYSFDIRQGDETLVSSL